MIDVTKIQVFDKIGLQPELIEQSILHNSSIFQFHETNKSAKDLRELIHSDHLASCLLLVDALTLHRVKMKMPPELKNRLAIAVISPRKELNDLNNCEDQLESDDVIDIIEDPITPSRLDILLKRTIIHFQKTTEVENLKQELTEQSRTLQKLNEIGISLSSQRNITKLLDLILTESMVLTDADAGSLYIVEDIEGSQEDPSDYLANKQLKFSHTRNYSVDIPFKEFLMPISPNSIAGYVALSGQSLNLPDVYNIPDDVPYGFGGRMFDEAIGYKTISMLVVPMLNRNNETIGVIQLINKKKNETIKVSNDELTHQFVIPYNKYDEDFIYSLASQAAVAYENQILFEAHKNLLDAFIKLIADAIDQKSPYTGGHCNRVPILTEMITKAVCESEGDQFKSFTLTPDQWYELHIAAWLHDCGKVTTPVHVMDKSTKLETIYDRIETVKARFEILKRDIEIEYLKALARNNEEPEVLEQAYKENLNRIDDDFEFIKTVNVGGEYLEDDKIERIREIGNQRIVLEGVEQNLLSDEEIKNLSIRKGTLTDDERKIINDHIVITINMLEKLPFPRNLMRVPEYAGGHHEKMDGTGYPKGLHREDMSIPSRAMAIADVFEALTAVDRPYKRGKKLSEAMDIMGKMKYENHLDPDILDLFVKSKVYLEYAQKYMDPSLIDEVDEAKILSITPKTIDDSKKVIV